MALFNCPECDKEISDKAVSCSHCGCPVVKSSPKVYTIHKGTATASLVANLLKILAYICWGGGLIVSIVGANVVNIITQKTEFSFSTFITLLIPYAIYGALFFCMSIVTGQVNNIYDMIYGLRLELTDSDKAAAQSGNSRPISQPGASRAVLFAPVKGASETWVCPACGTRNPMLSHQCRDCGKYR